MEAGRAIPKNLGTDSTSKDYPDAARNSKEVIQKVLGEKAEIAQKRTRLTWNRVPYTQQQIDSLTEEHLIIGRLVKTLGYAWINKKYYVQNGKILKNNGEGPISIDQVDDFNRPYVQEALGRIQTQILEMSPATCKHCFQYTAKDFEDYAKHLLAEHPDEAEKLLTGEAPAEAAAL